MEDKQKNQTRGLGRSDLTRHSRILASSSISLPKLILASTSSRRAEILRAAGWPFRACPVQVDETRLPDETAAQYVERLACLKARAAAAQHPSRLVLGADTVVVIDSEVLGKPRDAHEARRMLRLLSGRRHDVLTGIALVRALKRGQRSEVRGQRSEIRSQRSEDPDSAGELEDKWLFTVAHERTSVQFADLTDGEINWYVATGEPVDKAGAYAIQGHGARFIERVDGDYFNVVGLPVRLLYELVRGSC